MIIIAMLKDCISVDLKLPLNNVTYFEKSSKNGEY